jgi:CheY-like chemotaxis protein
MVVAAAVERMGALPDTLALGLDLASDLMPIMGSPPQLQRALTNLVTNAREAMGDIGTITIRTWNAYLDEPTGRYARMDIGEYVALAVGDTGPGIRPEIRANIFDAYFTTKMVGKRRGSGLGLSVVESIVEDHHGRVDLESEPGVGTRFTCYFPPSREVVVERVPTQLLGGTETILVVDDDEGARTIICEYLSALGYSVCSATSGEEALVLLKGGPVDLLVLDMVVPDGIDGAETYRRALGLYPEQRAIVLSGYAEANRLDEVRALGVSAFLRKPVQMDVLAQTVRAALDAQGSENASGAER